MCRSVSVVKNVNKLDKLVAEYNKKKCALEDLADGWLGSLRQQKAPKRKMVTVKVKKDDVIAAKRWGEGKSKVDAMEYKMWELDELMRQIREEEAKVQGNVRSHPFCLCRFTSCCLLCLRCLFLCPPGPVACGSCGAMELRRRRACRSRRPRSSRCATA